MFLCPLGGRRNASPRATLLKLRKVELLGFKSFCEKTQITFSGNGITCIVGPNGCGKSNIVDAVSWVLGEQSHKLLRAERMSDCIFNGTAKRPPLGLSEVLLTLVDPELAEAAAKVLERPEETSQEPQGGPLTEAPADGVAGDPEAPSEFPAPEAEGESESESNKSVKPWKKRSEKPAMHLKPGEVVIGRRLYRSGQSEYLINGRVARLRDVQELFMGMGLGPDSYAIIEQGRIGLILNSKPMDRRAIIEEAAGVTMYKTKKRLAEAKLEASKTNLSRVNDILVEVDKQLASLKRQASKARRYAEMREQMRGLMRTVLASKARELDAEAERLDGLLRESSAAEDLQTKKLRELESEQERLSSRSYELDAELRHAHNLLGQSALELDRTENRIAFNREQVTQIEARATRLAVEMEQAERQAALLEARTQEQRDAVAALREETARLENSLQAFLERAAAGSVEQGALEARIEEHRQLAIRLGEDAVRWQADFEQAEESLTRHASAQEQGEQGVHQLESECARHDALARTAEEHWRQGEAQARQKEQAVRDAQARLATLRQSQQETNQQFDRTREELSAARARRTSLGQILNDRAYTAEAVQKLFTANGESASHNFRAVGVLADYAEVEEQYEGAVEQFLREELEYVVVETFDHARAGIALLRDEMGGRATFFVDSLRHLKVTEEPPVPFHADEGVVARLDRLVSFRDPLGAAAKQFLPKLRGAFLVETAVIAEKMAREYPQHYFITLEGTCYHGRMVSGGRPGDAGPLALKRELRRLETEVTHLDRAAERAQADLSRLEEEMRSTEAAVDESLAKHVEAEKSLVAAAHRREQALADLGRLQQQLAECRAVLARQRGDAETTRGRAEHAQQQRAESLRARAAAEADAAETTARLTSTRQELQAQQQQLAALREELVATSERFSSAETLAQRMEGELNEARQRATALAEQRRTLSNEKTELEAGSNGLERQAISFREEKAWQEERKKQLEQEWDETRSRNFALDDSVRQQRQSLDEMRAARSQHEVEKARNDSDREHLRQTSLAEVNAQPEDLIAQEATLLTGEELAAAETNYSEMKARIEAMGPVNMMALEEYQECEQRADFLTRERDDLVQSIENTQQAIRELDEVSRQKFEEAFTVINRNFADAFRALFGGGTGEMRLTEPDSSGDAGIDIVAQPPGKRLQNVLLLSGGEKAMTALALLIAVFRYQPSPFCILDEVDAPLDEPNVGRFNKMLSEMGEQTQFIIVTHNRRTMEMGSVLYGVTMQEPGVSKIVSVRWEEAQQMAEPKSNAA
jgi:chromosome segregation protein